MRSIALIAFVAAASILAACSSTGSPRRSVDRNLLRGDEIRETGVTDAYEAIQRLRPRWLTSRGATSIHNPQPTLPVVYMDQARLGDVGYLRSIQVQEVEEIRYLDSREATMRYGTGHTGGAIVITSRRGG